MLEPSLTDLSIAIDASPGSPLGDGLWRVTWTVRNQSSAALSLREMRIPHDQFHSEDLTIHPPIDIPPGASASIETPVLFVEPAESTLVYPFVIVRATWKGLACRLFGRLRVEADQRGVPRAICEEVTVRPAPSGT
jgi:hypothetical protein